MQDQKLATRERAERRKELKRLYWSLSEARQQALLAVADALARMVAEEVVE